MKRLFVESSLHYAACLPDPSEAIEIILKETDIYVDEINDNMESALFLAVRSNNHAAMAVLMRHGADYNMKNMNGVCALELIQDYDECLESHVFDNDEKLLLKVFEYRDAKRNIRRISEKLETDYSPDRNLFERSQVLTVYLNTHRKSMRKAETARKHSSAAVNVKSRSARKSYHSWTSS